MEKMRMKGRGEGRFEPTPEREGASESFKALKLDSLEDSQIIRIVRMLGQEFDDRLEEPGSEDLWELLKRDLRTLIDIDPERAKALLSKFKDDHNEYSKQIAAAWTPFFLSLDFEF